MLKRCDLSTTEGGVRVNKSYVDREAVPNVWSAD